MHGANPQNAFPGEVDKQPCYRSGMRGFFAPIAAASVALLALFAAPATAQDAPGWSIAIHGGAGTIARESPTSLAVVFVASSIEGLPFAPPVVRVPLPRPRGYVETTFLDDEVRISRGSRGTLFVTVRARG